MFNRKTILTIFLLPSPTPINAFIISVNQGKYVFCNIYLVLYKENWFKHDYFRHINTILFEIQLRQIQSSKESQFVWVMKEAGMANVDNFRYGRFAKHLQLKYHQHCNACNIIITDPKNSGWHDVDPYIKQTSEFSYFSGWSPWLAFLPFSNLLLKNSGADTLLFSVTPSYHTKILPKNRRYMYTSPIPNFLFFCDMASFEIERVEWICQHCYENLRSIEKNQVLMEGSDLHKKIMHNIDRGCSLGPHHYIYNIRRDAREFGTGLASCFHLNPANALNLAPSICSSSQVIVLVTALEVLNYTLIPEKHPVGFIALNYMLGVTSSQSFGAYAIYDYQSVIFGYIPSIQIFYIQSSLEILSQSFSTNVWWALGLTISVLIIFMLVSSKLKFAEICYRVCALALQPGSLNTGFHCSTLNLILLQASFILSFLYTIDMTAKMTAPTKPYLIPTLSEALQREYKIQPDVCPLPCIITQPVHRAVARQVREGQWGEDLRREGFVGNLSESVYWQETFDNNWFRSGVSPNHDYKGHKTVGRTRHIHGELDRGVMPRTFQRIPKIYGRKEILLSVLGINSKPVKDVIGKLMYDSGIKGFVNVLSVTKGKLKQRWDFVEVDGLVAKMGIDNRILSLITLSGVMLAAAIVVFLFESY